MSDEDLFKSIEEPEIEADATPVEPDPQAEIDAAFEAGLNETLGTEEPEQQQAEVKQLIAGMTEDELKAAIENAKRVTELEERLSKMHDKAFGTIGQLKQTIEELRNSKPVGGSVKPKLSKDTFKALAEYLDDEGVAEAIAYDLSNVEFGAEAPQVDVDAVVTEKLGAAQKEFERKLLTIQHPDWQTLADTEEFQGWTKTLAPEAQEVLMTTWDGVVLSNAFSAFKEWRAKKVEAEQKKQERLESAIQPATGARQSSPAAEDYFNQGLKKVIAQRRM